MHRNVVRIKSCMAVVFGLLMNVVWSSNAYAGGVQYLVCTTENTSVTKFRNCIWGNGVDYNGKHGTLTDVGADGWKFVAKLGEAAYGGTFYLFTK